MRELRRLHQGKAAGTDGISPWALKAYMAQLCGVQQHLINMSLHQKRFPMLWKTSCLVPVPKKGHLVALNDYRPTELPSQLMKVERLVLAHLTPAECAAWNHLHFAYQPQEGVDDVIIYLLQRAYSSLKRANSSLWIMFFDFFSFPVHHLHIRLQIQLQIMSSSKFHRWHRCCGCTEGGQGEE